MPKPADLVIVTAMPEEMEGIRRHFPTEVKFNTPSGPWHCHRSTEGKHLWTALVGIKAPKAAELLAWVKENTKADHVLLLGCCGALTEDLKVGDALIAQTHVSWPACNEHPCSLKWIEHLQCTFPTFPCKRFVTSGTLLDTEELKSLCRTTSRADVVEMEGYLLAEQAERLRLSFASVRWVLDRSKEEIEISRKSMYTNSVSVITLNERLKNIAEKMADAAKTLLDLA